VILLNRIIASFRKRRLEAELDEELRFHLEMEIAENERRGMSAEDARNAARRSLGGIQRTKEAWRDCRFATGAEDWLRDLRHGARTLARSPAFTLFAMMTLALGIGANTVIFSALHALVLRPLPYPEPEALAAIHETSMFQGRASWMAVSAPNLLDWRARNQVFEDIGGFSVHGVNLARQNDTLRVPAARVEPEVFRLLRVTPWRGRIFSPEEREPGGNRAVVISHGLWQSAFGGDPNIIGQGIGVDGATHEVVGVMPDGFEFPPRATAELWTPLGFDERARASRGSHWLGVVARLRPGVSWAAAQSEVDGIARDIARQSGRSDGAWVQPLHGEAVRSVSGMLTVLAGAAGFVLLLACANVSHLILARAAGQQRELALRAALGAGRWRIVRLMLTESLVISALGGAAAFLAAKLCLGALPGIAGGPLPGGTAIPAGGAEALFCAIATLASALLAGLVPALRTSRIETATALKDTGGAWGPGRRLSLLMVTEIALTLTLLIGATLLIKSLKVLGEADLGFRPERLLTMKVALPGTRYGTGARADSFYEQMLSELRALPGVSEAAAASVLPVESADNRFVFTIAGDEAPPPGREPGALVRTVSPGFFGAMGIPLLRGRDFQEEDKATGRLVAVVNRRVADIYFPGRDPVGESIALGVREGRGAWMTVVGVVGNHWNGGAHDPVPTLIYTPMRQFPRPLAAVSVVLRTPAGQEPLAAAARGAVRKLEPNAAVFEVKAMGKIVSDSAGGTRMLARMLALFAALALVLAVAGVYGVMAHLISRRTHEVGVRLALGANRRQVLAGLLGRGLANALAGAAVGLVCAAVVSGGLRAYLIGVRAIDPWTYLGSALAIVSVALLVSFAPAWRASRGDPLAALRSE
jgi:putative ABC transport system permease protein